MKALDDYNNARKEIAALFDTEIYDGIQDYRESWWWIANGELNWVDENPEGSVDDILEAGPDYSEYVMEMYTSKCGNYVGMGVHTSDGNLGFYIFDNNKCVTHDYE